MIKSFTLALCALAGTAQAAGLPDLARMYAEGTSSVTLDIDNDSLLLNRDDGFYTSGLRIGQRIDLRGAGKLDSIGWRIGQDIYTPSDTRLAPDQISPSDHPYASWLFAGVYRQQALADGTHWKLGIDVGCLGSCAGGKWTQTELHRLIGQQSPQGWDSQVKNELGAVLYGEIAPMRWQFGSAVDLAPTLQARFGNIFTDAGVSVLLRAGQLNVLPDQPTLHAFVRAEARAVGYNATLQGGYFSNNNVHTVDPKRLVGELEIGATWKSATWNISASVVRRGNEIEALPNRTGRQDFVRLLFSHAL